MDRAQIRHVAVLAELELSEDEEERLASEIGRIVAYVKELDAVDTDGVAATAIVTEGKPAPFRNDEHQAGIAHDDALAGAPKVAGGGFSVPAFVE